MGVHTLIKDGEIADLGLKVTLVPIKGVTGEVHYNPGIARDPEGQVWTSIRSCIHVPHRPEGYNHPMHYQNFLHVGKLDEKTLKITGLKEIKPEEEYLKHQWGIEDIRLFWRDDGLHGIGVVITPMKTDYRANEAEILIDYEAGTYKLLKDYGMPFGHSEKNWMPPEHPERLFDFTYSPTQIVLEGQIIGPPDDLFLHNGTPLIKYGDGFLSLMHIVTSVHSERTYVTVAAKWDKAGHLTHISQMFHFNVGWREKLRETIEFACGLLWSAEKEGEEILVGLGVKDELVGFCRIPVDKFNWEPYVDTMYYNWRWIEEPNRQEVEG